mmetsp:Transcript_44108/g.110725  ORF Transcript_44108/g.110725 Transcript_44108/m.110725 type:complete len:121 (+) Transcript_44108:311-673(+)
MRSRRGSCPRGTLPARLRRSCSGAVLAAAAALEAVVHPSNWTPAIRTTLLLGWPCTVGRGTDAVAGRQSCQIHSIDVGHSPALRSLQVSTDTTAPQDFSKAETEADASHMQMAQFQWDVL